MWATGYWKCIPLEECNRNLKAKYFWRSLQCHPFLTHSCLQPLWIFSWLEKKCTAPNHLCLTFSSLSKQYLARAEILFTSIRGSWQQLLWCLESGKHFQQQSLPMDTERWFMWSGEHSYNGLVNLLSRKMKVSSLLRKLRSTSQYSRCCVYLSRHRCLALNQILFSCWLEVDQVSHTSFDKLWRVVHVLKWHVHV